MKKTKTEGTTRMWYAVDKDGWGKLYTYKPQRKEENWLSHKRGSAFEEPEPNKERLIPPYDAKVLGRTWEDKPIQVEIKYEATIQINEEL